MKGLNFISTLLLIFGLPVFYTQCTETGTLDPDGTEQGGDNPGGEEEEPGTDPDDKPDEPPVEETYYYTQVTSELSDWTGEYLITYSDGERILVLDGFNDKYGTGDTDLASALTADGIPAEIGDRYKAVVSASGSGYSIYVSNIGYIGFSGTKNSLSQNTSDSPNQETDIWKISLSGGLCPANDNGYSLKWNPSAPRFACYRESSTNCVSVTLYKRSADSGEIPDPGPEDPDENPDEPDPDPDPTPEPDPEPQPGATGANTNGWLKNWEIPAAAVAMEEGVPYSEVINESLSGALAYTYKCENQNQLIVTHTYTDRGRRVRNYTMLFDATKKAALWEAYGMHKDNWWDDNVGRRKNWKYDPAIPKDWQSAGCTSNYHKGHQVASNDRQANITANQQTFYLSNQTPQWQTQFNDGVWNQLEQDVQNNAPTGRDTLYVVTGPLYQNNMTETDDGGETVPIPSAYWKCIMLCSFDSSGNMTDAKGIGYYFPKNAAYTGDKYYNYSTTIDEVEEICGFDLFANVPEELQAKAESVETSLF